MGYKLLLLSILFNTFFSFSQIKGVGINEDNPQQALHLGSQTGTIRVDGLNSTNNTFNGGGVDKTYPLYVDENGDLTLTLATFQNSDGSDALTSSTPLASTSVSIPAATTLPNNGSRSVVILPYTITVTKPSVLEVKYSISFEVLQNATTKLKSARARRISTFYTLNQDLAITPTARRYGQAAKCYFNNNTTIVGDPANNAAQGNMFNSTTTYIPLSIGTHTIRFYGEVNCGSTNEVTLVNFGVGTDSVFMRLY
jgi:hypothetical protein